MYPDFLGIGAQKAGTTWLHANLRQHPQLWLPPVKEIHYFDRKPTGRAKRLIELRKHLLVELAEFARGRGSRSEIAWAARYCLLPRSDAWYASLFPRLPGRMTGEICPGYASLDDDTVAHIHRCMPDARILYLLRDPIARSWSTAAMHFRDAGGGPIEARSAAEIEAYLVRAKTARHDDYLANLDTWSHHYGADRIFVAFFDQLEQDPAGLLASVLRFLGVDAETAIPRDVALRHNAGPEEQIPEPLLRFLARYHLERIRALDQRFSNRHTKRWRERAEEMAA